MALTHGGNSQPLIDKEEHRYKNVGGKAVIVHGYDATTDSYFPINTKANGDGTYSFGVSDGKITPYRDFDTIDVQQTSGTVDTIVYKRAGATVRTTTITYVDATKNDIDTVVYS